jgi:cell division septation protein DedD
MKNNESGEFELVLGNRQLLSGFFVVVILFAVFFVMGYIVGRNSTPATLVAANRDPGGAPAGTRPQASTPSAPAVQSPTAAELPKDDPGSTPSEPRGATTPERKSEAKSEAAAPVVPAAVEPAPGEIYLQVTAVKQEVAETVAKTLKDKGFPTSLSPGPAGKTRVLVGPYTDRGKLGDAKAELERLGFAPFVKK